MSSQPAILIGSILLEPNRWAAGKRPTYQVSRWLPRFAEAGLDGVELWENHAAIASPEEVARLAASSVPLTIFNTYCGFGPEDAGWRERAARQAIRLGSSALKFNVSGKADRWATERDEVRRWLDLFPKEAVLICECHPGTMVDRPETAKKMFDEWGEDRIRALVHPFTQDHDSLAAWFDALGDRIVHAHVQIRDDQNRFLRLADREEYAAGAVRLMRDRGFTGSWTLEFTRGVGGGDEDMEALYRSALEDLAFLRERLA